MEYLSQQEMCKPAVSGLSISPVTVSAALEQAAAKDLNDYFFLSVTFSNSLGKERRGRLWVLEIWDGVFFM